MEINEEWPDGSTKMKVGVFNQIQEHKHIDMETKSEVNKTIGKLNYIPTHNSQLVHEKL